MCGVRTSGLPWVPTKPETTDSSKAPARKRRGFPVLPTLMFALVLPVLLGLGLWQLGRHHWKAALLAEYAQNIDAPLLDLGSAPIPADSQFRHVRLNLDCPSAAPTERAGRNLAGAHGFAKLLACTHDGQPLILDAGWSARPDASPLSAIAGVVDGRLIPDQDNGWILVADHAQPPLLSSAPPTIDTIPNNHLTYAVQWFGFAAVLAAIYGIWLRRWLAQRRRPA